MLKEINGVLWRQEVGCLPPTRIGLVTISATTVNPPLCNLHVTLPNQYPSAELPVPAILQFDKHLRHNGVVGGF